MGAGGTALRTDCPDVGPGGLTPFQAMWPFPAKPSLPRAPVPSLHWYCNYALPESARSPLTHFIRGNGLHQRSANCSLWATRPTSVNKA